MARSRKWWARAGFYCYCALMIWLLYGQRMGYTHEDTFLAYAQSNVNLQPFKTIRNYLYVAVRTTQWGMLRHIIINLLGNVMMFVPLGFFLPLNWQRFRPFWKLLLWVIGIIAMVELVQLVTMLGSLDVDDLILNVVGASIGFLIWRITK